MTAPSTLGGSLARALAIAVAAGMGLFAVAQGVTWYISQSGEECAPGVPEESAAEIVEHAVLSLVISAPVGVALALALGRRLSLPTTARLDELIGSARRMTGDRLDERLPVGATGDPLDRLSEAINGLLARVERGVAAQQQFAADASHELRTPLTVISTKLEVARRKPRDAAHWARVADDTLAEVQRMNVLVDKLLQLSRAGAAGLHRAPADLYALAAAVVERAGALGEPRAVRVALVPGAPVRAEVDADAVSIVLDNLIRNAVDHAPAGSEVTVRVSAGALLAVEDRGPGVPVALRARVFEPFARGDATDRATGAGVGLGLAICQRIVDGHRGTIAIEDRDGGGARFVVRIPEVG